MQGVLNRLIGRCSERLILSMAGGRLIAAPTVVMMDDHTFSFFPSTCHDGGSKPPPYDDKDWRPCVIYSFQHTPWREGAAALPYMISNIMLTTSS